MRAASLGTSNPSTAGGTAAVRNTVPRARVGRVRCRIVLPTPKFEWRGRTANGQKTSGFIVGEDKRDALDRLRAVGGVTVLSLKQRGDDDDSVPDALPRFESPATPPTMAKGVVRRVPAPRPFRGLVMAIAFVGTAAGVNAVAPIITYRCERASDGAATCAVTRRMLGYPIDQQVLAGVERAEIESPAARRWSGPSRGWLFATKAPRFGPRIGTMARPGRGPGRSRTPEILARDFNAFLSDPSQTSLSRCHVQTVPMIIVGVLLLLALGTLWLTWLVLTWRQTGQPQPQG